MLPRVLAGSYEKYKQDTALFTTWLAQTAAACGYKSKGIQRQNHTSEATRSELSKLPPSSTHRLKGKERKAAKAAAAKPAEKSKENAKAEPVTT